MTAPPNAPTPNAPSGTTPPSALPDPAGAGTENPPAGGHQPPGNPWFGLLDAPATAPGNIPVPNPGQQAGTGVDPQSLIDLIGRAVTTAVDRRINQLTNPQWQQAHPPAGQQPPPHQYPVPTPQQVPPGVPPVLYPTTVSGPSEGDQREARLAVREYLGDRIAFGSEAERAMAVDLAAALIPAQLTMGMSPNQAAQTVAGVVAERVTALRRDAETRMLHSLRSRGLLVEPDQAPAGMVGAGGGIPRGGTPAGTATVASAAAKAAKLAGWAAEENTRRGWTSTPN